MKKQSLPWFRMYVDFLNDPKMVKLAFEDQRHFIGLLALKSDGALDDEDCDPDLLDRIVAQRLWIDHAIIREVKKRLIAAGLIDEAWQPVAWNRRQCQSDSSTERTRRYRSRQAQKEAGDDETSPERHGDGADREVDTDKEEEAPPKPPTGGSRQPAGKPAQKSKPKKPPASDVADTFAVPDWMPMTEWRAWIEMRRAKGASKAPNTEDALKLAVRTLDKLRGEGQTPADVLDQSTLSGWTGLFAVKANQQRDLGKGRTGRDANGNAVVLTSQQRSFKDVDYGENRIPSWLQDVADDVEAGSKR